MHNAYYIYMAQSSSRRALYIGVTNNLERRIAEG
jgi:predicted GIY-YIG superfamily endonuclease